MMNSLLNKFGVLLLLVASNVSALEAVKTKDKIQIDGIASESSWELTQWQAIDQLILGTMPSKSDFNGRFKMLWDEQYLYLLVEITDDILFDQHIDPKYLYWDDDCLEVFIDEDGSGGDHRNNFNAFAYHVALDHQVVDLGEKTKNGADNFVLLNDHINSKWRPSKDSSSKVIWELAVSIYDDSFQFNKEINEPVKLSMGKSLGFMLAYCDNDGSKEREHFIGSTDIQAVNGDKNLGYITADVFQHLILVD